MNGVVGVPRAAMWLNLAIPYLFLFRGWGSMASVISVATLISYVTRSIYVMVFRSFDENIKNPLRIKGMPVIASMIYYWAIWPLTGKVTLIILIGLPIYFYYQAKAYFQRLYTEPQSGCLADCLSHILDDHVLDRQQHDRRINIIPFGYVFSDEKSGTYLEIPQNY